VTNDEYNEADGLFAKPSTTDGGDTMIDIIKNFFRALKHITIGDKYYYMWIGFLSFFVFIGLVAYGKQAHDGLIVTAMRDQVSWGLYISNFTFLVGVAAAAVVLVVPAYLYGFKPIKEIVLLGEMMAVAAVILCILFVMVDLGRPERIWHILPFIGEMNFPSSLLAWDVIVLSGYLLINATIVLYVLYQISLGKEYSMQFIGPLIILSIPWAVGIHTVTAFLYNGLAARPFWNSSILAPRFLASAFCSGPALMLLLFQIIRKVSRIEIENRAIFKIAELIAYAMCINIFLEGAEVFKEFYSGTIHVASIKYLYFGLEGNNSLVPWIWWATILNITALILFLNPKTRENFLTLNAGCIFMIIGIYIEKGMGLVVPGFVPGTLGEIYDYSPTNTEILITMGIWALGILIYTLMLKFAIPIYTGELRFSLKSQSPGTGVPDSDLEKELLASNMSPASSLAGGGESIDEAH
jgi:Ni/Fe-hydrogenase subunit HybB-like protein